MDVVAVLTDQPDQRSASNYWAKLKQRLLSIRVRNELTAGADLQCRAGPGMTTRQYKNLKRLKKGNLRDSAADIYRRLYVNSMIEYLQGER